jgi:DNA-binding MarR family transcriptional regulator
MGKRMKIPKPPEFVHPDDLPPFLQQRTSFLLHKVGISMLHLLGDSLEPLQIAPHHFMVMNVLSTEPSRSQIGIGSKVRFDRNKMVNIVDELEQMGLARREANKEDRRAKVVVLTDKGRAILDAALKLEEAVQERVMAALSPHERKQFHDMLKVLAAGLKQ